MKGAPESMLEVYNVGVPGGGYGGEGPRNL
jgi:hypothetical protein